MRFAILNYVKPDGFADRLPENEPDAPAWGAYTKALIEAGVLVGGAALIPPIPRRRSASWRAAGTSMTGPYAETKEQLGGFYLIEVPDIDTALEWAARNPAAATGAVEVRPVHPDLSHG